MKNQLFAKNREKKAYPWLKAIVAIGDGNRVIGSHGKLPWSFPEEYQYYLRTTKGGECVMARQTWESDKRTLGRKVYVVSSSMPDDDEVIVLRNFEDLPAPPSGKTMWVCGGSSAYSFYLPFCSEIYVTHIHGSFSGDAFFPEFEHLFHEKKVVMDLPEYTAKIYERNE